MKPRYHFIDNLRWFTVVLVLIYHVFYNFNAQGVFGGIGGFREHQWWDTVCTVLYPWFMPLMFVLAGASSRYALKHRTAKEFRQERARKLLVPSTLGLLIFGWVLGFVNMKAGGGAMPEGLPFAVKFFIGVISGTGPLWFIQDLYIFSLLLFVVRKVLDADRVEAWLDKLTDSKINGVIITFIFMLWPLAQTQIDEVGTFDGLFNLYRPIYYFVVFLVGYYIFSSERVHKFLSDRVVSNGIGIVMLTGFFFLKRFYGEDYTSPVALQSLECSLYCGSAVFVVVGVFKRWFDFSTPFTQYMTRSSFGLYVVHMTVCTSACLWLQGTGLPLWLIYSFALIATFVGSIVLWEILRRIPFVRWCMFGINLKK